MGEHSQGDHYENNDRDEDNHDALRRWGIR